jgi:exopolysaccharide production protein ExoQ
VRRDYIVLIIVIVLLDSVLYLLVSMLGGGADDPILNQIAWASIYVWAFVGVVRVWPGPLSVFAESLPVVAIVALACMSTLWSADPAMTGKRSIELLGTTTIAYYVAYRYTLREFLRCYIAATAIAAGLSIVAIVLLPSIGVMQTEYAGAWRGIYGHKNILGAGMSVGIITLLVLLVDATGKERRVWWALLVAFAGLLVGSRSVTSIGVTLAVAACFGIGMLLRSKWRDRGITALIGFAAILVLCVTVARVDARTAFALIGRAPDLTGRTEVWSYALQAIGDRPYLGWGYKCFWVENGPVEQYMTNPYLPIRINDGLGRIPGEDDWLPAHAHNGFIELSLDIGLVGTAIFVLALALGMWRAARLSIVNRGGTILWPLLMMIYCFVSNITEASIATYNAFPWVVFVIAFLYARPVSIERERRKGTFGLLRDTKIVY